MLQCGNGAVTIVFVSSPCSFPNLYNRGSFISSTKLLQHRRLFRRRVQLLAIRGPTASNASLSGPAQCGVEWLTANGGKLSEVLDFSKMDVRSRLGVKLSENKGAVLKGTELAEFPEGTFLTPAIAKTLLEKEYNVATDASLNLGDESLFALCLLVERAKQKSSEYAGLLEALPDVSELDSPEFWSDEELEMLRGSPIYLESIEVREAIKEEWNRLNSELFEPNRQLFREDEFSFEMYKWGLGIVDSRTVSGGSTEEQILAPVLVHLRPASGGRKATGRVETSGGMFFSKKRFVLSLDVDMNGGDEVNILTERGSHKSEQLVERGVVMGDGTSKWEASFQMSRLDRFYDDKIDIVERAGLGGSRSFDMLEADRDGIWEPPENMESFLRLLCLSGADAFLLEAVFRGEVWEFMGLPVSEENEKAMCELMKGTCEDALEEYEQGRREGQESEKVNRRRKAMAESVVEGEKRILKAALKKYEGRLKSLDQLEYYAERRLNMLDLLRPVEESEIR